MLISLYLKLPAFLPRLSSRRLQVIAHMLMLLFLSHVPLFLALFILLTCACDRSR